METLITFLVALLVIALVCYLVTFIINLLPMAPVFKNVIYAIFALILLLWLAERFLGHSTFFGL